VIRALSTARGRLALVFMGLFAASGLVLLALTYALVAANVKAVDLNTPANDAQFRKTCEGLATGSTPVDANLKLKCATLLSHNSQALAAAQRADMLESLALAAVVALVVLTAVSGVVGWLVAGRILRPVSRITAAARAAGDGDLSARLALTGPRDELRELADTFDDMLDRLQAAFVAQQRFIANASHELRTPLTVIRTTVDVALAKPTPTAAEFRRAGDEIRAETDRAGELIDALLTLTRSEGIVVSTRPVALGDLARDVAERAHRGGVRIEIATEEGVVLGDAALLERLIGNLVENALLYNRPDGEVAVTVTGEGEEVVLRVTNTGPPVPADEVDRLFEPFARLNDRTGDGFGLGLSIVRSVALAHGGTVTALAPASGGLEVTVRFARAGAQAEEPAGAPVP